LKPSKTQKNTTTNKEEKKKACIERRGNKIRK